MRILLTADPMIPVPPTLYGGIERVIAALIVEYRRRGCTVGLVALPGSTVETDFFRAWPAGPYGLHRLPASWRNTMALQKAIADFRPDVLHSFSRLAYLGPALCSRLPKLMSYQRETTPRTIRWAARLAGDSLQFTGCSEHIAVSGRRCGGRWQAIPNFVDTAAFDFVPAMATDAPLVFLSRLERIKGAHTAIAMARAAGRRLIIAGNQVDSDEGRDYFRDEIAPWLGRDGIEYVGAVDDVAKNRLLGAAAAMLVPIEWQEPFGIVFAEALACGTPVISTPCGAVPEIIRHGEHGFIVNSLDEGVQAIAALPTISRQACRARVEQAFSLSAVAAQYLDLYASHRAGLG